MLRPLLTAVTAAAIAVGAVSAAAFESPIVLDPNLPLDVSLPKDKDPTLAQLRDTYNLFAWNTFIALNWPGSTIKRGEPKPGSRIGDPGPRVWETYKSTADTFPTPPHRPTPWDNLEPSPSPCGDAQGLVLQSAGKVQPVLSAVVQPMSGKMGYLVDQNGNKVYIDVLMNKAAYDFIYNGQYYDADKQAEATENLLFPIDGKTVGPINVKPSWKILVNGKDDFDKFYHRQAQVVQADKTCVEQTVGLVGLHIAVKTKSAPQWVWATFEHRDNAPSCKPWGAQQRRCEVDWTQQRYSFANPKCKTEDCPINQLPTAPTADKPVQVVRIIPIPDYVEKFNTPIQALLKGTVWENYMLVNTQFPADPSQLYGTPSPSSLANTTLETYNQGETPLTQGSGCLQCHFMAPTAAQPYGNYFSDFDFQFTHAKSYGTAK